MFYVLLITIGVYLSVFVNWTSHIFSFLFSCITRYVKCCKIKKRNQKKTTGPWVNATLHWRLSNLNKRAQWRLSSTNEVSDHAGQLAVEEPGDQGRHGCHRPPPLRCRWPGRQHMYCRCQCSEMPKLKRTAVHISTDRQKYGYSS
jgi:hypothetical protein